MTEFTSEYIKSVRMCSYLIEPPASEVVGNLCDHIERLQKRIAELESVNEDQALTISQNDYAYTIDKEMMEKRIAELETYIDDFDEDFERLKDEIKESNGLLRSAFMIAKRDGKETNWEAWRKQLEITLTRQHKMMYGEKAQQALNEVTK